MEKAKTFFIRISYESRNGKKSMILWKVSSGGAGSSWVGVETMFEVISGEDGGSALRRLRDSDSFFFLEVVKTWEGDSGYTDGNTTVREYLEKAQCRIIVLKKLYFLNAT